MRKKILILHHPRTNWQDLSYTINILKQEWKKFGLDVVEAQGIDKEIPADVAINHVDLTVTPDAYRDYFKRYPVVINGNVWDISKTTFSRQMLSAHDDYEGRVIVKTKANCGGMPDLKIETQWKKIVNKVALKCLWWSNIRSMSSGDYFIFESMRDVPKHVWKNNHLVVEKFLPERTKEGKYCLRAWSFLGSKNLHVVAISDHPVVKAQRIIKREILPDPVPDELIAIRKEIGIDYGRFDYAIHNASVVLYDVNRTTTMSSKAAEAYAAKLKEMAWGIYDYF